MIGRCWLAALSLGWTVAAHAIVNIESMRTGEPPSGYSGAVNLSVDGESGNTDKLGANVGARLQWHGGAVTNFAIFRYAYAETSGIQDTNKLLFHARHIRRITARTAYEGFVQAERNKFARLSFRGLIGGGARLTLSKKPDVKSLHLGIGGFYSRETLENKAGATDNGSQNIWRLNSYINYLHHLNDQVSILSTTYYQPTVEDFGDYRLLEEASLSVKMTDTLSLNLSLDLTHDSKPPQGVKKTDTTYSSGIEYNF
jgi:putative salt-induced outer membrane protein YdiY